MKENVLQARNPATAKRLAKLIRSRLETMEADLWRLVRDGSSVIATHAVMAAAVKHSRLLRDFLDLVVREQYRLFSPGLTKAMWDRYLDTSVQETTSPTWTDSTRTKLRRVVFQILVEAGYLENSRSLRLQPVHLADPVARYLADHDEHEVLRCLQVGP